MASKYVLPGYWVIGYAEGDEVDLSVSSTIQSPSLLGYSIDRGVYLVSTTNTQINQSSALSVSLERQLYTITTEQNNLTNTLVIEVDRDLFTVSTIQVNETTVNEVSKTPFFLAATTIQVNESESGTLSQDSLLNSSTTTQFNDSSVNSITKIVTITVTTTTQNNLTSSNSVVQEFDLIIENVAQTNNSTTNSVSQNQIMLSDTTVQDNNTTANTILQIQKLVSENIDQINNTTANTVDIIRDIFSTTTVQNNYSTTGQVLPARALLTATTTQASNTTTNIIDVIRSTYSTTSTQINNSSADSILQDKIFHATSTIQDNSTTVNSITPTILVSDDTIQINTSTVSYFKGLIELSRLRILYEDIVYTANVTGNTKTNFNINDLKLDNNRIWRSNSFTEANITLTWNSPQTFTALVISNNNLSQNTTIRLVGYENIIDTISKFDTGKTTIRKSSLYTSVLNMYSYGNSSSTVMWLDPKVITKLEIFIEDTGNASGFIEISKIMLGQYWEPKYGQEVGISTGITFNSTHSRTQAGNIYTNNGSINRQLKVPLNWLLAEDRLELIRALKSNGINKPIFVSAYPISENIHLEELHQIYGKLSNTATLTYPLYEIYTTEITVEEV